ncbi:MAG: GspJ family type II secretion system protein [Candidatus Omnitrophica bacterium]|nr:GspJ family type II secretion system protein [Candidatus Omnitrophota bacterium]
MTKNYHLPFIPRKSEIFGDSILGIFLKFQRDDYRLPNRTGFTLVELLIAVAISSIVFLAIISTYSLTLKTLEKWDGRQEDYYLARNVFRKMRSEISSVYFITDSQAVSTSQEKTDYNGLEGDEKTFSFYTTAKSLYFPFTCLTKITYKFIINDENKGLLIREEEPLVNFTLDEHKYLKSYVWSDNLKNFNFKYSDGKDWLDSWDIQQTEKILKAVKIELISSHEEKFSTIIYIPTI